MFKYADKFSIIILGLICVCFLLSCGCTSSYEFSEDDQQIADYMNEQGFTVEKISHVDSPTSESYMVIKSSNENFLGAYLGISALVTQYPNDRLYHVFFDAGSNSDNTQIYYKDFTLIYSPNSLIDIEYLRYLPFEYKGISTESLSEQLTRNSFDQDTISGWKNSAIKGAIYAVDNGKTYIKLDKLVEIED